MVNNVTGDPVYVEAHMTVVGVSVLAARAASPPVLPDRMLVPACIPERRHRQATE